MNRLQHCTIRHLNTFELLWTWFLDRSDVVSDVLSGSHVDKSVLYSLVENNVQKLNLLNKCLFLQNSNLASCYMTNCKRILLIWVTHATFTCNSAFGAWVQRTSCSCSCRFGLFEAMSAIEMMDPKMDAGMIGNQVNRKVLNFEQAVKVRAGFTKSLLLLFYLVL